MLFPSTYQVVLAVKGCACPARWRPCGRLRPLTAALHRVSPVPGNSAQFGPEHVHVATFSYSRILPSRSRCCGQLPFGQYQSGVIGCAAYARRTDAWLRSADLAAGGARIPVGQTGSVGARGVRNHSPGCAEPGHRIRRDVPQHGKPDIGVSTRGDQGGLANNSTALLVHNHPSGAAQRTRADRIEKLQGTRISFIDTPEIGDAVRCKTTKL